MNFNIELVLEMLEKELNVLNEKQEPISVKQESKVIKLPKLQISEDWGSQGTVDRQTLERIVKSATKGRGSVFDKLNHIQEKMNELSSGAMTEIKTPSRILSQIIILETLAKMFNAFSAGGLGFLNEAFLSAFYGGHQIAASEANSKGIIADVIDSNGEPISLKTLTAGKDAVVKGSLDNLLNTINASPKKRVLFHIFEKQEGRDGVNSLIGYEFEINKNNLKDFGLTLAQDKEGNERIVGKQAPQFKLAPGLWKANAELMTHINFSKDKINAALSGAVSALQEGIADIFNNVDDLTSNLTAYFTSVKNDRIKQGNAALEAAKKVEPQAKKVIEK